MKWTRKWGILWALAHLPGGRMFHEWMLRRHGELAHLEQSSRFQNAVEIVRGVRTQMGTLDGLHIVEIGTGWVPAVPLALAACGARVQTFDVRRLTDSGLIRRTWAELNRMATDIAQAAKIPPEDVQRRLRQIEQARDLNQALSVHAGRYVAPANTCRLPIKEGAADVVMSSLVMSCIPAHVIPDVLRETWRILSPSGIALHRIRMTDEYAANDPNRNHFDYLQYSRATWDRWCNHRLKHQNRLRASQFSRLFDGAGFDCVERQVAVDAESIPRLKEIRVDESFAECNWTDLATMWMSVVLKKRTPGALTVSHSHARPSSSVNELVMGARS